MTITATFRVLAGVIQNVFVGAQDSDASHDDGIQVLLFKVGHGMARTHVGGCG